MNPLPSADAIAAYLTPRLPDYLEMLRKMVAINSFTTNPDGINALGQLTADLFAPLGFGAESIESHRAEYGSHLALTRHGRSGRQIGLVSHLDTVFPPEEEVRNNFHWREEGDRIYGPGTVDIKGGTVVAFMMLDALRALAPQPFEEVTWTFLLDASEEADGEDFGALCRERLGTPETIASLIFEGGYYDGEEFWIVHARKGMAVFTVEVEGRASHAGSAHEHGANAVVQLAELVTRLATLTDYKRQVTVNVGTFTGGTVTNRVPHSAQARLEMRAYDQALFDETVKAILALAEAVTVRSAADGYPCRITVTEERRTAPWPVNPATEHLLSVWKAAAGTTASVVVPEARGGLSDGNHFWTAVPTIDGLGPAGGNAHCSERSADGSKDQEYVYVPSLVPKATLNCVALLKLLAEKGGME